MGFHKKVVCEAFVTMTAVIWLFFGMSSLMYSNGTELLLDTCHNNYTDTTLQRVFSYTSKSYFNS